MTTKPVRKRTLAHGLSAALGLARSPIAVWIGPDGKLTPQAIEPDVLAAKARRQVTVRLPAA